MRISDWSSDVCSSDLAVAREFLPQAAREVEPGHPQVAAQRPQRMREGLGPVPLDERMAEPGDAVADHDADDGEPPVGVADRGEQQQDRGHGDEDEAAPGGGTAVLPQVAAPGCPEATTHHVDRQPRRNPPPPPPIPRYPPPPPTQQ